jgi:hypothetical protein
LSIPRGSLITNARRKASLTLAWKSTEVLFYTGPQSPRGISLRYYTGHLSDFEFCFLIYCLSFLVFPEISPW